MITLECWQECLRMLRGSHVLIAGATGSGKSVLINSIIYTMLVFNPNQAQLILIDPKRVELVKYRKLPHTIAYETEPAQIVSVLKRSVLLMENRYKEMQRQRVTEYNGAKVYIVIDELADLMTTNQRQVMPLLQRIAQLGRAAKIHLICATQCPNRKVIPAELTLNFTDKVALRCDSAIESRQVIGCNGAEKLPLYGKAFYKSPGNVRPIIVPYTDEIKLLERVEMWENLSK